MTVTREYVTSNLGNLIRYDWTKEACSADDTITGMGPVVFFQANHADSSGIYSAADAKWSESINSSTGVNTVTIRYQGQVTDGFIVIGFAMK